MPTDPELVELIDRAMLRQGLDATELARRAEAAGVTLDTGTIGDMLNRKRMPRRSTLGKMIRLLGIDLDQPDAEPMPSDFEAVVQADPTLIPEAKEHLIRQYELLQRASLATPTNVTVFPVDRNEPIAAKKTPSKGRAARDRQDMEGEAPDVS